MVGRRGFTLIELLIVLMMVTVLMGSVVYAYVVSLRVWRSGQNRFSARTGLSQGIDRMTRDLWKAESVTTADADELVFVVDSVVYDYDISSGKLTKKVGAGGERVLAEGIDQPSGVDAFGQSGDVVTIDLQANIGGDSVRIQTKVRPRNM